MEGLGSKSILSAPSTNIRLHVNYCVAWSWHSENIARHAPYSNYVTSILELMISICRKLSRGWNNFELMVSICRKLSSGRNQKKKVPALAQLFQPPTNCKPGNGDPLV
jgi:hypothetical protein